MTSVRRLGGTDLGLLEQMFQLLPDVGFFVKDKDLKYVAASDMMARFCGVERPQDIYGKDLRDFFPDHIVRRYESLDRQVLATGRPSANHFDLTVGGKGESVWVNFSRYPLKDKHGATVGIVAVARHLWYADKDHALYSRMSRVVDRLRADPAQQLDLKELARLGGVSRSQLQRDFARLLNTTPRDLLHQIRMERAVELLSGGLPIVDVAYACGYSDQSAFTRRFREVTGMSPSAYRQEMRQHGTS